MSLTNKVTNHYETLLVLELTKTEEERNVIIEKIKGIIEKAGSIEKIDLWGKRRLAYPINYQTEGYYVVIQFTSNPELPKELDRVYRITDGILRFLVIKRDERYLDVQVRLDNREAKAVAKAEKEELSEEKAAEVEEKEVVIEETVVVDEVSNEVETIEKIVETVEIIEATEEIPVEEKTEAVVEVQVEEEKIASKEKKPAKAKKAESAKEEPEKEEALKPKKTRTKKAKEEIEEKTVAETVEEEAKDAE